MSVYCTLVISDAYLPGAVTLAHQLRKLDPDHDVVCLAIATLAASTKAELARQFARVHVVEPIDAGNSPELALLCRPELRFTTTKLHLWSLPYDHVVYLDADTLPVRGPLSRLFEPVAEGEVGAAPDTGWPDIFNSGVLCLRPSPVTFGELLIELSSCRSFDGSDQGLLNQTLRWVRLPFVYNVTISSAYQYRPAYLRFADDVRILHFIGAAKPWNHRSEKGADSEGGMWWLAYDAALAASPSSILLPPEALSDTTPYDAAKLIAAPPDYWDAAVHAPLRGSRPEAAQIPEHALQHLRVADDAAISDADADDGLSVHIFPEFGKPVVQLPFEQAQAPAERSF